MTRLALLASAALIPACATSSHDRFSPAPSVTPAEALAIAAAYENHRWMPQPRHAFHDVDPDGVRVDTPDIAYRPPGDRQPGWWIPGRTTRGVPYQWGGFDTPQQFDAKLARGHVAGDLYTPEKRRLLDAAVSRHAAGIDCSGFVSRCWRLPRSYSTRELPSICTPLASFDDLRPGDIINKHNAHTLLFVRFVGARRDRLEVYETGRATTWRVARHIIPRRSIEVPGYRPLRYTHMAPNGLATR